MPVPSLVALDGVETAIRAMVADGTLAIPSLRVIKSLRPQRLLQEIEDDTYAIVFLRSVTRQKTSAPWQEYQVDVGVELIRKSRSYTQDHEEERQMLTYAQTVSDELAKRTAVSLGFMASNTGGVVEEAAAEELSLISVTTSHIYRIMHEVT